MAQEAKGTLPLLFGILGWHGVFLLFIIVAFKLFLVENGHFDYCPCDWHMVFSSIMFLCPSILTFIVAFFAYFRQDDDTTPWKVFKKFYEVKFACHQFDEITVWESHAEYCIRCKLMKRDWSLAKIALSAIFSLFYPLIWLSLCFLQGHYYVCATVGPSSKVLPTCNMTTKDEEDHDRLYGLAEIHAKSIGSIILVCTFCFVVLFVVLYGEIKTHLSKKYDWSPNRKSTNDLQVLVSVTPGRCTSSSGAPEVSLSSYGNICRDTSVTSIPEDAETEAQSLLHQPKNRGKDIRINLSSTIEESLQECLQNGAWQGINIRCSQYEEGTSRRESYAPFRPASRPRLQHQRSGDHTYESLLQLS